MDSDYLKASVGSVLAKGIAETCHAKPDDPVEYLAQFLLKSVADEAASKELSAKQEEATKAAEKAALAADKEAFKAKEVAEALAALHEKEDKRLENLLAGAESAEAVYNAALSYVRARTGANGYVMLTDLPEKLMPPKPVAPPPAAEGEEAPAEEEAPPPEEPAEPEEPPPKFVPQTCEYTFATSTDQSLLSGKTLARPAPIPEEGSDEPPPPTGVGEGVTFTAIDDYINGASAVYHEPKAIENRSVKFWHLPRIGAYAAAPFEDFEGNVKGVLSFDTLGLERPFTADEISMLGALAKETSAALVRIEGGLCEAFHEQNDELAAAVPPEPYAVPAEGYGEGVEPFDGASAAYATAKAVFEGKGGDYLKYLSTRRECAPAVLPVLKAVCVLLEPTMKDEMPSFGWADLKMKMTDEGMWDSMLSSVSGFDVLTGSGAGGFEAAAGFVAELTTVPEEGEPLLPSLAPASKLALALYDWVVTAIELSKLKDAKEEADEVGSIKAKLKAIFDSADTDGGGTISRKELTAKLKADGEIEALLGQKDAKTFRSVISLLKVLEDFIGIDADEDSKITFEEFEAALSPPPAEE